MSDVDFNKLLKTQVDQIEKPKLFPAGNYDGIIVSYEFPTARTGTRGVQFNLKLIGPREDVDSNLFEEAGGITKLQEKSPLKHTFWITPDSFYRLGDFLKDVLELPAGRPTDEVIPDSVNVPLVVSIAHQAGQKEGEVFLSIEDVGPAS